MTKTILPSLAMSALADRVQRKALMYLVYSTDEIDAQTAATLGFVSKVVKANNLDNAVDDIVAVSKNCPMPVVLGVKEYVSNALTMDTRAANNFAKNLQAVVMTSTRGRKKRND